MKRQLLFLLSLFFIAASWAQTPSLSEGFEGNIFPPEDWIGVSNQSDVSWTRTNLNNPMGGFSAYINRYVDGHTGYLITPRLSIKAVDDEFSFWLKTPAVLGTTYVNILISLTDNDTASFSQVPIFAVEPDSITNVWKQYTFGLEDYIGEDVYLAFQVIDNYSSAIMIDNVLGPELYAMECNKPINLTASNSTQNSVTISFDPGSPSDNAWWVYYRHENDDDWDSVYATNNPYTLSNLIHSSLYEVMIKTDCGDALSEETAVYTFRTSCGGIDVFPWFESFDNLPAVTGAHYPPCWHKLTTYSLIFTYPYPNTNNYSPPASLYFYTTNNNYCTGILPAIDESVPMNSLSVNFMLHKTSAAHNITLGIIRDTTDMTTFDSITNLSPSALSTWEPFNVDLAGYSGNGRHIAFRVNGYGATNLMRLDNVTIYLTPTCSVPTGLENIEDDMTSTSVTIDWDGDDDNNVLGWIVEYKKSEEDDYQSLSATSHPFTINGLESSNVYDIRVAAICSSNDTTFFSNPIVVGMPCEAITNFPWEEGFEGLWYVNEDDNAITHPWCWHNVNGSGNTARVWKKATLASYVRTGSASLQLGAGNTILPLSEWFITPVFTLTGDEMLRFWAKGYSNYVDELNIQIYSCDDNGVFSSASDTNNFTIIMPNTKVPASDWTEYEIHLSSYIGDCQIAFVRNTTGGYYLNIDDISISAIPECPRPFDVSFSNIGVNSVDISWVPSLDYHDSWWIHYKESDATDWDSVNALQSPFTLTGLTANTTYDIIMKTDCSDEVSEATNPISFKTFCDPIDAIPWSDSFDDYGTGTAVFPDCWTRNTTYAGRPYVATTNYSSPGALYFYAATANTYNIATLPALSDNIDISSLMLSFMYRKGSANDTLKIGVMTDPYDETTWEEIDYVVVPATVVWHEREVSLGGYVGSGKYIGFKVEHSGSTAMAYVDNVELSYIPDCYQPGAIRAENITSSSADITWSPGNANDDSWWLYHREADGGDWDTTYTVDNSVTLSGLEANTEYEVILRTICGNNELSDETPIARFRTECEPIEDLPWSEDFDSYGTGTSAYPFCWSKLPAGSTRPNISTTHYSPPGGLNFYAGVAGSYNIAVLPELSSNIDISTIKLDFMYRTYYITDTLRIGVMTDPNDVSTWEEVSFLTLQSTATWYDVEVPLTSYIGEGRYIALRVDYTTTYTYAYIDDLSISYMPVCSVPYDITLDNTSTSTIELSWTASSDTDMGWWLYYKPISETAWDSIYTTDESYTLSSLSASTGYEIYFRTDCDYDISEQSQLYTFRTDCGIITDIPWEESFEGFVSGTRPSCWSFPILHNSNPSIVTGNSNSGITSLRMQSQPNTYTYAITPQIGEDIHDLQLGFMLATSHFANAGTLEVGVMSSDTDLSTFELVTVIHPHSLDYAYYEVGFGGTTLSGNNNYIAFRHNTNSSIGYFNIDDVRIDNLSPCAKIQNLRIEEVSGRTALVDWNMGNQGDTDWWIYYKPTNSAIWDSVHTTDKPHILDNLELATLYEIRIKTECDIDEYSELSDITNFYSDCYDGAIDIFPWEESFDEGLFCWTQEHRHGSIDWTGQSAYNEPHTGGGFADFFFASSTANYRTMLVSPQLNIQGLVSPYVSFWYMQKDWLGAQDELKVYYRTSETADWTEIAHFTDDIQDYRLDSVALPNPSATYQIGFEAMAKYGRGVALDDITVYDAEVDGCVSPTGLSVEAYNTFADFSWNPSDDVETWEVKLGEDGDITEVNTASHTFYGLSPLTNYTAYVRSNCDYANSIWSSIDFITDDVQIAPEITLTVSSAQVTQTTAVFMGVYTRGSDPIDSKGFEYKKTSESDWTEVEITGDDNPFTYLAEELSPELEYEVKAYITTVTEGTMYSDVEEFTTLSIIPPTVTTDEVQVDNEAKKATFTGTTAQNTEQIIARGFEYKKDEDDWSSAIELTATGSTTITATTQTLDAGQEYMVRAYAETASGKTYGEELDFETTSSLTTIDISSLDITLYPNPASNSTTISIKGVDGKAAISIVDAQGRVITSVEKSSSFNEIKHSFNLESLAKGVYYIRVDANSSIKTQKLIVQ